ncbi:MAG: MIP/aquaporin family protein [Candidatus Limnocylindrales bacterium]
MTVQSGAFSKKGWGDNIWGESLAEFLGTFTLIAFGDGVVAMAVAALNGSGRAATSTTIFQASGDWLLITWGWAFAVTFGIYVAGGVTGAHINPAVTLAFAVKGDFPWNKVIPYWIAQVLGAFAGAWLVFINYSDAIAAFEKAAHIVRGQLGGAGDSTATYSIFATFPAGYYHGSLVGPFIDQVIGTFFLLLFIFAVVDKLNMAPVGNLAPFIIGLAVAAIGMSYGANAGYAINPARDFGPRLFAYLAGWGQVALPGVGGYFWVPIIGPLIGGVIAAFVYHHAIHRVLIARTKEPPPEAGRVAEG